MIIGILAALGSSSLRAILNVLDRLAFGHRRAEVILLNLINNFLPLFLIFPVAVLLKPEQTIAALGDLRNIGLAGLVQLVAYAFSAAFRELTIPQVIVYSKLPDLFIPLGIYALDRFFSVVDFLFSALTTLVCVPIIFEAHQHQKRERPGPVETPSIPYGSSFSSRRVEWKARSRAGKLPRRLAPHHSGQPLVAIRLDTSRNAGFDGHAWKAMLDFTWKVGRSFPSHRYFGRAGFICACPRRRADYCCMADHQLYSPFCYSIFSRSAS
ncbi:MAG: hypothetical protein ABDI20_07615 [Candidatus Bipolaricaulaceae bacterium]